MKAGIERTIQKDEDWFQKLVAIVPLVAPAFAFAFVVGYFFAFDISWFPLFSLSEHIVFAIRALPIAIGASVAFLITLTLPRFQNHRIYSIATYLWILVLGVSAILVLFFGAHLGVALSFVLVAIGAHYHHRVHGDGDPMSFKNILHWAITLMVACLMAGWLSAVVWRAPWVIDQWLDDHKFKWGRLPLPHIMIVKIGGETVRGHPIFMGNKNILFYQYDGRSRMTRMLKRDDIDAMFQCDHLTDCDAPPHPSAAHPTQ
jgi:cytochrome bd-type quinol oxidase subunit 1